MDGWGISDGYWDVAGEWHSIDEEVRTALLGAIGADGDGPPWTPYWSVTQGDTHHLESLCEIRLEDGTELPPMAQLPPDLPVGYHDLLPDDGGPVTRLAVAPRSLPSAAVHVGVVGAALCPPIALELGRGRPGRPT